MNGADLLCEVLLANDINVCFANPGTSEMHFVAALDRNPRMRCVLGLFEGVVTGAADGYGRMADKPAATLLHLGPGLANGLANLHNARRARTPIVNIVGDHADYHLELDAPLTSDIESLARPMSHWVGRVASGGSLAVDANEAILNAIERPGVSTLILPANAAWNDAPAGKIFAASGIKRRSVSDHEIESAASAFHSGRRVGLLLGGKALRAEALAIAGRISVKTSARILAGTANARIERGRGRVAVETVPYPVDMALKFLRDLDVLISIGAESPVAFFAYPEKPSRLLPSSCEVIKLADEGHDLLSTLARLAAELGVSSTTAMPQRRAMPELTDVQDGALTSEAIAAIVAQAMPENCIVCNESITSATSFYKLSENSAPHDFLSLTGGAIGIGIPMATGAAIACPDRKVIALQADGSGMYTLQGLWTQARERLQVVTIIFANRRYAVLEGELRNVGVSEAGPNAQRMLELVDPTLGWVQLANGMGVEAGRAGSILEFSRLLDVALKRNGPFLIEAII